MKKLSVDTLQGDSFVVEYDEYSPCRICGEPVIEASMNGIDVCPWCDCGCNRDGTKWSFADFQHKANAVRPSEEKLAKT